MNALARPRFAVFFSLVVLVAAAACASSGGQSRYGATVAIPNLQAVAGRWDGILQAGDDLREDFVDVVVTADGAYEARSARTIGALEGRGRADVQNGQVRLTGPASIGIGTLHDKDGKRTLVVQITGANGRKFTARLTPKP